MKILIKGVSFNYGSLPALDDVTLEIKDGAVTSIVGPNGSGKTTLLRCVNNILKPKSGIVFLDGTGLEKISAKKISRMMGYVPQVYSSVFPFTVFDTVLMGRKPHINWGVSAQDLRVVSKTLKLMGLEGFALRHFDELSGGEKQKVIIARAFAQEPEVLLLDEPTSNLDLKHQLEVLGLIKTMVKRKGITVIMAIHNLNLASKFSDEIVMLKKGKIFAAGKPGVILTPEIVRQVYGVEILRVNDLGKPYILPIRPI